MAIDPDVIPPSSSAGNDAVSFVPKWAIYLAIGGSVLIFITILKALLPLIFMGLLFGFIWKQARNY
mgnify:CR=1 FL=1|tara:strand:- start:18 stop:215 length:198 start_codon:yes stop_codon:yes gene_type:complete